jgi:Ca2+-binding RTX toxin-like protein
MKSVAAGLVGLGLIALFAPSAFAQQPQSWNGEWAGNWRNGGGAQVIFAGNELIGVYWRGDYLSQTHAALSHGGATVAIDWASGGAVLTRDGPTTAHIVVHESGRPETSFVLTKDH